MQTHPISPQLIGSCLRGRRRVAHLAGEQNCVRGFLDDHEKEGFVGFEGGRQTVVVQHGGWNTQEAINLPLITKWRKYIPVAADAVVPCSFTLIPALWIRSEMYKFCAEMPVSSRLFGWKIDLIPICVQGKEN
jgi:hypothetical protein